ncbi:MAG: lasso peptide biosynthesis B2 protein [Gemmatimonadota bacterium]|nr:lasso peptide biosynthesis B2 protein [Gemmatimonadota bacterium]
MRSWFGSMIKQLVQFIRLPGPERWDLLEAVALCTLASVLLRVLRFRQLAPRLGRLMAESPGQHDSAALKQAARVHRAIATAARHLPWKPVCLPQAVTAQWMLRRRGIPSTLYLGTDPARGYDAHAWVRAGSVIVTGGPGQERFAIVSSFA